MYDFASTVVLLSQTRFRAGLQWLNLMALLLVVMTVCGVLSAEEVPLSASLAVLDGQIFEASIVRDDGSTDGNAPLIDRLVFEDGLFVSEICTRYDFVPAHYWVRTDDGAIWFYAELRSPTSGVMVWKGAVKDGDLEGTMRWTRERWYRTIDAEHRIAGHLVSSAAN